MLTVTEFESIKAIKGTFKLGGVRMNVYLYLVDELLIDSGPKRLQKEILNYLSQETYNQIFFTHHHEDHTGNASILNVDVPTYIHPLGIQLCEKKPHLPLYRRVFWGSRKSFTPEPIEHQLQTKHHTFELIHTPGHAPDHLALLEKEKGWLFTGDLYVMSHPKSIFAFESIPEVIKSLEKVLTYDFDTVFCSHAGILTNGRRRLEEKLHYLRSVQDQVLQKYNDGKPASLIQKELFPSKHILNYFSLFENSSKHIVTSIINKGGSR
ncbi:MBL fold metallo-hydrolase [Guptibacillus hwajinpoensis]|uniref:Glyoxylase-like metal-dependent hydrolase (Beta-lactamase superfamily II) n=1 Tax=Guptibacillus hwajinpoensis TaxID=208199 RepID=A0ABU0JYN2_9BACL|nr:MBL fold metallo-hydrolase [Alkalihalobacillus hemicentroti]MDQ0482174.1 glyoxylase-like metal-dependent hydrolase (beta-lactamase superfamily II) [Alkalihalobacillus hemicentroti]